MKVRICFTVDVDERFRRALRQRTGQDGLASREEVRQWYEQNASSVDDDMLYDYDSSQETGGATNHE